MLQFPADAKEDEKITLLQGEIIKKVNEKMSKQMHVINDRLDRVCEQINSVIQGSSASGDMHLTGLSNRQSADSSVSSSSSSTLMNSLFFSHASQPSVEATLGRTNESIASRTIAVLQTPLLSSSMGNSS